MDTAQAKSFAQDLQALQSLAGWRVHECIGSGKSAVVMRATKGSEVAALKVFHPELIERFGESAQLLRIEREKRLIGLNYPNIVRVYEAGICPDNHKMYVAMEHVEGKTLKESLSSISPVLIEPILESLAKAAKHLEDLGIVHRDIKPENIMIRGDAQTVVLLDFGVMRPIGDSSATDQIGYSAFVGTHQYCPSEMIHGKVADTIDGWRAVSFYQLGAVLFSMLSRKPLFEEHKSMIADLVNAIDLETPVLTSEMGSPTQRALAKKCLLKNPAERLGLTLWNDFFFSESDSLSSIDARKKRLLGLKGVDSLGAAPSNFEKTESLRLQSLKTQTNCKALRAHVEKSLDGLQDQLPLRTVTDSASLYPNATVSCVFNGLNDPRFVSDFNFQFCLKIPSENIAEVFARAGRGATPEEMGWQSLGLSLDSLDVIETKLTLWMLDILEELIGNQDTHNE